MLIPLGPHMRRWAPNDQDHDPKQGQLPRRTYRPKASVFLTNLAALLIQFRLNNTIIRPDARAMINNDSMNI